VRICEFRVNGCMLGEGGGKPSPGYCVTCERLTEPYTPDPAPVIRVAAVKKAAQSKPEPLPVSTEMKATLKEWTPDKAKKEVRGGCGCSPPPKPELL
jgi:hypothetical protein